MTAPHRAALAAARLVGLDVLPAVSDAVRDAVAAPAGGRNSVAVAATAAVAAVLADTAATYARLAAAVADDDALAAGDAAAYAAQLENCAAAAQESLRMP